LIDQLLKFTAAETLYVY